MIKLSKQSSFEVLVLLLLTDFVIVGLHIAARIYPATTSLYWAIDADRSFGETFQYIKELWLIFSFAALTKIRSDRSYWSLSLLFCYLFIDDLFFLHERWGDEIAIYFGFPSMLNLRSQDYGELLVNAIAGSFFAVLIGVSYWLGSKTFRHVCQRVLVLLAGLIFCGIVLDAIHVIIDTISPKFPNVFNILEDGGEMLFMSALCWYGVSLLKRGEHSASSL
ncbi:hypothetical protein ACQ4M3_04705 [Leptolyngbya sp. AN03gr2]|uniref:hypothetical protein n=1 Tax=unclassified Leptolyngbya TaxID=2650499 RepID=UPI003D3118D6